MGFPGYFLIVADFIKWAKAQGIPVGPGRGSGAGSLVAYALTITDLDPLRYSLLFERFLNPERVSMPDFDIDFCMDRREEVIDYVKHKYGADQVGQIITFGALLSKAAVRDVGRVLQMPYGQVDRLVQDDPDGGREARLHRARPSPTEPRLREEMKAAEVVERCLDYAQQLEGLYRNASTHAAGVVIADRPLDELVPVFRAPGTDDMQATQFNMKWVEQAGLVKFDFLGLKTLTMIDNAVKLITATRRPARRRRRHRASTSPKPGTENDILAIPLDDAKTYELYARARVAAVFQVESSGMMDALKRMKPTCIEDIVALVALYRPGPMENIPAYCEVKNGTRPLESHPPDHRPHPEGDAGDHRLPGAGDGDRPGDGGLLARRRRPAAPGDGQEDPRGDGQGAAQVHRRRDRQRACPRRRPARSSTSWRSSPTTASTSPTPPPTRWSATRPPGSRRTTRSSSWPAS